MFSNERLHFSVKQVPGSIQAFCEYGDRASEILESAYPSIGDMLIGGAAEAIRNVFLTRDATIFLLYFEDLLVGYSSYWQRQSYSFMDQEMRALSLTERQWDDMQAKTVMSGWTAIDSQYQHKGGWSQMMDVYDKSLEESEFLYICRQVRKANSYDEKVLQRYRNQIIFQAETYGYGIQTYFRLRIPKESTLELRK